MQTIGQLCMQLRAGGNFSITSLRFMKKSYSQQQSRRQGQYRLRDEPVEFMKSALSQLAGNQQERKTEKKLQLRPSEQQLHQQQEKGEKIDPERQTRILQALRHELEDIKRLQNKRQEEARQRREQANKEREQKKKARRQLKSQTPPVVSSKTRQGIGIVSRLAGQRVTKQDIFQKQRQTEIRRGPQG